MKLINKEIILKKIKSIFLLIATFFAQIKLFFKKNKRILLSFIHAFWMITLMLFWVRQPFIFDYEFEICKDLIDIETVIRLGNTQGQKEYQNKFLFLNVSKNKEILTLNDEVTVTRTSKNELQKTLNILAQDTTKFKAILLDILIDKEENEQNKSAIDSLQEAVDKLKGKIILTNEFDGEVIKKSAITTDSKNTGIATYNKSLSDAFYRLDFSKKLSHDNKYYKQTPLLMYELIENKKASQPFCFGLFYTYKNDLHLYQNVIVPKMTLLDENRITLENAYYKALDTTYFGIKFLKKEPIEYSYNCYDIGTFNSNYHQTAFDDLKKPIIIIGDFESDIHYTTNGQVSGPMVLANSIISLYNGSNKISFWYLFFIISSFTFISYLTFFYLPYQSENKFKSKYKWLNAIVNFIIDEINFVVLALVTLIGIFVFKYYMFLFFNTIYLMIVSKIIDWNIKRKQKNN